MEITDLAAKMDRIFRVGCEPFVIDKGTYRQIVNLGPVLLRFYRAVNELYYLSVRGDFPPWIHEYLDGGKTEQVIDYGRMRRFRSDLPVIIRPDLILTEEGFIVSELDAVPGGFGLLAELSRYYHDAGFDIIGGRDGIIEHFKAAVQDISESADPGLAIVVSDESMDYFPEMEWISEALSASGLKTWAVKPDAVWFQEDGLYLKTGQMPERINVVYRFFELFDLKNIPKIDLILYAVRKQLVRITPPLKSYLEEKLLFALVHHPALRDYLVQTLEPEGFQTLAAVMPQTWIMDPRPLPPHAVIPDLYLGTKPVTDWRQLKQATQRQRELVIKISGFSELAWGSRGVCIGHDVSGDVWAEAVERALRSFPEHPYVLQKFHKGKRVIATYYDGSSKTPKPMQGRVRLCPYYLVHHGRTHLAGILATICPLDKKLIHGMTDAIMVPTRVEQE